MGREPTLAEFEAEAVRLEAEMDRLRQYLDEPPPDDDDDEGDGGEKILDFFSQCPDDDFCVVPEYLNAYNELAQQLIEINRAIALFGALKKEGKE